MRDSLDLFASLGLLLLLRLAPIGVYRLLATLVRLLPHLLQQVGLHGRSFGHLLQLIPFSEQL